jgi:hypothetical protein
MYDVGFSGPLASDLLTDGRKVYVSIATIYSRLSKVIDPIVTLLEGVVRPDHIFLMISEEPYMLDPGDIRYTFFNELYSEILLNLSILRNS